MDDSSSGRLSVDERTDVGHRFRRWHATGPHRMETQHLVALEFDGGDRTSRAVMQGVVQAAGRHHGWLCRVASGRRGDRSPAPAPMATISCRIPSGSRGPAAGRLPIVRIAVGAGPRPRVAEILLDRAEIVRAAAEHLASCGIRRIGLMSATPQPDADAWESAFRNLAGQGCSDLVHLPRSAGGRDQSLARLGRWVASLPSGVGIIAINDSDAAAAVDACRRISRAVPADIAIVGVGNDEILCEVCRPSLTSVDLGLTRLGHEAVRILDSLFTDDRHVPSSPIMVAPSHVVPRRSSDTFAAGDPLVAEALQAMRRQLASDLTPQRLARDFGLSRTSLERRFKAALGRSIHDELLRLRITEAKRLLMETPLPIREVATAVGYGSVQYMTTVIRRHCGITPAQLRETAGRAPLGDRPDDPEPS